MSTREFGLGNLMHMELCGTTRTMPTYVDEISASEIFTISSSSAAHEVEQAGDPAFARHLQMTWEESNDHSALNIAFMLPSDSTTIPAATSAPGTSADNGSRGGGRSLLAGVHRQIIHVPIDNMNGIPKYSLTKGARKNVEILGESLSCAIDVDKSFFKPHQPLLGVHSFKIPEDFVFKLFGHKNPDSTRKFFSAMGFRYKTVKGIMEFTFNVGCYKLHGWKLHKLPAGSGSRKPHILFERSD